MNKIETALNDIKNELEYRDNIIQQQKDMVNAQSGEITTLKEQVKKEQDEKAVLTRKLSKLKETINGVL
jgi:archaellum component FlaC